MGERGGIDDNERHMCRGCFVDPQNQFGLRIALESRQVVSELRSERRHARDDLFESYCTVDRRLARPEQIQVRAIEE